MRHVTVAVGVENEGIRLDREGRSSAAASMYEEAAKEYNKAIATCVPMHAGDQPGLTQHRQQVLARALYLRGLNGAVPSVPVEAHISRVQLGMQSTPVQQQDQERRQQHPPPDVPPPATGAQAVGAFAVLGAGAGAVILGGPIAVVGGALAATATAVRGDDVGEAARNAGRVGVAVAQRADELNKEHHIGENLTAAGRSAWTAANEVNNNYGITTKVGQGLGALVSGAGQLERQYHITDKLGAGLSAGLGAITAALSPRSRANVAASSAAGPLGR